MICQWCASEYHDSHYHPGTCGNCGGPKGNSNNGWTGLRTYVTQDVIDDNCLEDNVFLWEHFGKAAKAYCDAINEYSVSIDMAEKALGAAVVYALDFSSESMRAVYGFSR